jgi:hypothetical protein
VLGLWCKKTVRCCLMFVWDRRKHTQYGVLLEENDGQLKKNGVFFSSLFCLEYYHLQHSSSPICKEVGRRMKMTTEGKKEERSPIVAQWRKVLKRISSSLSSLPLPYPSLPLPYHFLTSSLPLSYHFLTLLPYTLHYTFSLPSHLHTPLFLKQ